MPFESRLRRLVAHQPKDLATAIVASRVVFRTAHLLEAHIDAALAPFGIAMRDYLALVLIDDDAVESLRPSDLSTTLDATRTQVTRLLDGLEKKGLAQRLPHAEDRRSLQLSLTDTGRQLMKKAAPAVHEAYRSAWSPLGAADTRAALELLRQVHDTLKPQDTP
jgi:MarR family transcriptional regulator, negative regulator of the multidrug operon emrRAB